MDKSLTLLQFTGFEEVEVADMYPMSPNYTTKPFH